jgi:thiamine kinase-like enzyme
MISSVGCRSEVVDLSPSFDLTAASLTALLYKSGTLKTGCVCRVETTKARSTTGHIQRLNLQYSSDSDPSLPTRVISKRVQLSAEFGTRELDLYALAGAHGLAIPFPFCLASEVNESSYLMVLEDLDRSHQTYWTREPSLAQSKSIAIAFADLHALWWGLDPAAVNEIDPAVRIEACVEVNAKGLDNLLADAPYLEASEKMMITSVVDKAKAAYRNAVHNARTRLTVTHTDPNPGNILVPKDDADATYMIDRQPFEWSLTFWLGASDLALMMVHWWGTKRRRKLERHIIECYVERLQELGKDTDFATIWQDYRLCATQSLFPILNRCIDDAERKQFAWLWKPQLRKSISKTAPHIRVRSCLEILNLAVISIGDHESFGNRGLNL